MATAEATFTAFLRNPGEVTEHLEEGDVILRRRDAEDLRLSVASRAAAVEQSLALVGRILADVLEDATVRESMSRRTAIPWMKFLPSEARARFYQELFESVEAASELGTLAPVGRLLDEWRATAAVFADPSLAARLRRPVDEGRAIQRPDAS